MSDPLSALIGAGASLLGGLFDDRPSAREESRGAIMGQAEGARKAAAKYGFNPLTLLGVSSPVGSGSPSMMGSAIGDAMALLADGLTQRPDVGQKEALEAENEGLREKLRDQTLRPEAPGVYDRFRQGPMIGGRDVQDSRLDDPVVLPDGSAGGVGVPDPRLDRGSGAYIDGYYVEPAPGYSPASVIEDNYGDLVGSIYGPYLALVDWGHNQRLAQRQRRPPHVDYGPSYVRDRRPPRRPSHFSEVRRPNFGFTPHPMFGF